MGWEEVFCPLCGQDKKAEALLKCSDRLREPAFFNYQIVQCQGCGLRFLNPRPLFAPPALTKEEIRDNSASYHPFLSLYSRQNLWDRLYLKARSLTTLWKRQLVNRWVEKGRVIVDIGCGTGEFLASLKEEYQCYGIEPEEEAAQYARSTYKLTIFTGSLESFPNGIDADLITFWHSLEHFSQPLEALNWARARLKPEGKVLVAAPNSDALDAKIYRSYWVAWDPPRHLFHFTPPTIKRLAKVAGLTLMRQGALPLDLFYNVWMSEQIKALVIGRTSLMIGLLRAPFVSIGGLLHSALTRNYSGQWYLFTMDR